MIDRPPAGARPSAPTWWRAATRAGAVGAIAGIAGGIVSGIALLQIGTLPATVSLVRYGAPLVGFSLYLAGALILGAGFGLLVSQQRPGAGETLYWGLIYGAMWWFLGPLTLLPVLQLGIVTWDVHSIQEAFASFVAHLLFGAVLGLVVAALRRLQQRPYGRDPWTALREIVVRGTLTGALGGWLLLSLIAGRASAGPAWWIGLTGGLCYAALYPRPFESTGPSLIRGLAYGFMWWIAWPLTLLPLSRGDGLTWSVEAARTAFALLPAYIIYGSAVAVVSLWLDGLARALFSDGERGPEQEGAGTEGLRAVGRGMIAGLTGGAAFGVILLRLNALPAVAALVGLRSAAAGLSVHLIVACLIGAGYGLLFRRQSFDVGSALGWGVSYGFLWWILGPLTLMPRLVGGPGQWNPEAAAALFGSLVGHLAFGAATGVVFHLLEARYSPWWIPWTQVEETRVARRKEQVLTSAPALWALVVLIALVLPIVLV